MKTKTLVPLLLIGIFILFHQLDIPTSTSISVWGTYSDKINVLELGKRYQRITLVYGSKIQHVVDLFGFMEKDSFSIYSYKTFEFNSEAQLNEHRLNSSVKLSYEIKNEDSIVISHEYFDKANFNFKIEIPFSVIQQGACIQHFNLDYDGFHELMIADSLQIKEIVVQFINRKKSETR